jgi:hypothetical protein
MAIGMVVTEQDQPTRAGQALEAVGQCANKHRVWFSSWANVWGVAGRVIGYWVHGL